MNNFYGSLSIAQTRLLFRVVSLPYGNNYCLGSTEWFKAVLVAVALC